MYISVNNDFEEFARVEHAAGKFASAHRLLDDAAFKLRLVLDEVVSNIIRYAYDDSSSHTIEISLGVEGEDVVVSVVDDGRPFDPSHPRPLPEVDSLDSIPTGGRGIFLLHQMADVVRYERREDRNWLTVRFASAKSDGI